MRKREPTAEIALSVIIPVFNGEATIAGCLRALYASDFQGFEAIVVDDGSTDRTVAVAQSFPCRVVTSGENGGPSAARNLGASRASGNILFFLDADILVQRGTLRRIVAAFREQPEISALFGSFDKRTAAAGFFSDYNNFRHHYTHQTSEDEAATFCGGFGAIRREAFFSIGGFDPRYRFLEDVEMGYRLHRAGHRIRLHKGMQLIHCKQYSLATLVRSDLFGRAVPWTRLMLESRIFRNDLNTRVHHVMSVPLSFLLLSGPAAPMRTWMALAWLAMLALFLILNRGFLGFVRRERGLVFACGAALMCWAGYLYSGLGVALGIAAHLRETRHAAPVARERLRKTAHAGTP